MNIPNHIAIIMDGNGRWAQKKGLPRIAGHKKGAQRVKEAVTESLKLGVKALTIFAFSTENWNRPKMEIEFLFSYLAKFLDSYKKKLIKDDIRLKVIGRRDRISEVVLKKIKEVEGLTKDNKSFIFNIAIDYGGRWDIVNAAKAITQGCVNKKISQKDINEELFSDYLCLKTFDPDLLIRTSGEQRVSNFLVWNLAYSEFYFTSLFWPDFDKFQLHKAIKVYSQRDRRFGEIHE